MSKLDKAFNFVMKKHPEYSYNGSINSLNYADAVKTKKKLLVAYWMEYETDFNTSLRRVLSTDKDIVNAMIDDSFGELSQASLVNALWDDLGNNIRFLFESRKGLISSVSYEHVRDAEEAASLVPFVHKMPIVAQ